MFSFIRHFTFKKISVFRRFGQQQPFDPTPRQEAAVCWHVLGISLYDQLHIDNDAAKFTGDVFVHSSLNGKKIFILTHVQEIGPVRRFVFHLMLGFLADTIAAF